MVVDNDSSICILYIAHSFQLFTPTLLTYLPPSLPTSDHHPNLPSLSPKISYLKTYNPDVFSNSFHFKQEYSVYAGRTALGRIENVDGRQCVEY